MPASSPIRASARQSGQLADHRSGTLVAERPDEQLKPNRPSFSALALCIARRSLMDAAGRSSKAELRYVFQHKLAAAGPRVPGAAQHVFGDALQTRDPA